ncbi:TIR domain-containing protein [Ensifer sp. YR511]|uniref:TIR domain-containing protein n=1 Tax=Ensifer sp. YR511 TaxID=1855294 RepID=UPI0008851E73|nr:TIR domain-containing protein [Ensifer sp. YR511]SDN96242.1 TIR domain-containing protein [Ensifer sp. YR511]
MKKFEVFVSYSHQDEWLKDELLSHLSALRRNGDIDVWHDRMILAGGKLKEDIHQEIETSDIFLFLISPAFISSDFCMDKEYARAKERHTKGEAVVIPVIVRACDWDVAGLRDFNAVPTDGTPVTQNASSKSDSQQRDSQWLEVVRGLKGQIAALKKKFIPPQLNSDYRSKVCKVDFIRHPALQQFDEEQVFIDPELYFERDKLQVNKLKNLLAQIVENRAVIISGSDRSGKSLLAKQIQLGLCKQSEPTILISGKDIKSADIVKVIQRAIVHQFDSSDFIPSGFSIVIDDFDECSLPDRMKEIIVRTMSASYARCVIVSFTAAPSVLFTPDDLPNPLVYSIAPMSGDKIMEVVKRWKLIGGAHVTAVSDAQVLSTFEHLMIMFNQTEAERYPYNVVTFLELIDAAVGSDIALSSFAACYETLIQQRLIKVSSDWRHLDECKNFLSLLAYTAFKETEMGSLSKEAFEGCLDIFEEQFLSDRAFLRKISVGVFLYENGTTFSFHEDYLWYFLCARYVARKLASDDKEKYNDFIQNCSVNIFQKKYANIIIYIAYFTDDNIVIRQLMVTLDKLFSKADDWILSDRSKSIILGLPAGDNMSISSEANVDENRSRLLREKVVDILDSAEEVVAKYTLPFLDSKIDDSEAIEEIDQNEINRDSYIKSVNALLRIHSVIGQILTGRSGTYGTDQVLTCITKMVQASGRYASLNHAIAAILIYDKDGSLSEVEKAVKGDGLTMDEKYKKVMRLFAFWSVFMSQNGLARYLNQDHSIRALERLAKDFESEAGDDGHIPYNFTSVLLIARLYNKGRLNKEEVEEVIHKYGEHSSLVAILRVTLHIYSYYMPMTIQDKQWISKTLNLPLKAIEMQRVRATSIKPNKLRSEVLEAVLGDEG